MKYKAEVFHTLYESSSMGDANLRCSGCVGATSGRPRDYNPPDSAGGQCPPLVSSLPGGCKYPLLPLRRVLLATRAKNLCKHLSFRRIGQPGEGERKESMEYLKSTAMHELGHALGWLGHYYSSGHVMSQNSNSCIILSPNVKNHLKKYYR